MKTQEEIEAEFQAGIQAVVEDQEDTTTEPDDDLEVVEEEIKVDLDADDEEDESEVETPLEPETEPEPKVEEVKVKETKQEHAWAEMRKENKRLQDEKLASDKQLKEFEELAKGVGFDSIEGLLGSYKEKNIVEEAKSKGLDPEFYKEYTATKAELAQTKLKQENLLKKSKAIAFTDTLDSLITTNKLTDDDKVAVLSELEADGYTLDTLLEVKSPEKLLKGYMVDKITVQKTQAQLKDKKKAFKGDRHNSSTPPKEETMEEYLAKVRADYKKRNGYA